MPDPSDGTRIWALLSVGLYTADAILLARLAYAEGTPDSPQDKYGVVSVVRNRINFNPNAKGYKSPYPQIVHDVIYSVEFDAVNDSNPKSKWVKSASPETFSNIAEIKEWNISVDGVLWLDQLGPLQAIKGATVFHRGPPANKPNNSQVSYIWNWTHTADIGDTHYSAISPKTNSK